MKEPPDQYRRRNDQHPEHLVAPERPPLHLPPFVLGDLLLIRLNAAFNHVGAALGVPPKKYGWIEFQPSPALLRV
jgi:hypothetical protein